MVLCASSVYFTTVSRQPVLGSLFRGRWGHIPKQEPISPTSNQRAPPYLVKLRFYLHHICFHFIDGRPAMRAAKRNNESVACNDWERSQGVPEKERSEGLRYECWWVTGGGVHTSHFGFSCHSTSSGLTSGKQDPTWRKMNSSGLTKGMETMLPSASVTGPFGCAAIVLF